MTAVLPTFDSLTLAAVVHSLQPFVGGRLQRVAQPGEHQLVLTVYASGVGEARWLIDCSTLWARTHLITHKPLNPPHPTAFCMTLRKYIEGSQIEEIAQRSFDRILDIQVRGLEGQVYSLTAELMGKHSNIILVGQGDIILQAAKLIPARLSRVREVLPGRAYLPPPASRGTNPLTVTETQFISRYEAHQPSNFSDWLRQQYEGISPILAAEIAARAGAEKPSTAVAWRAFDALVTAARANSWEPVLLRTVGGIPTGAYLVRLQTLTNVSQEAASGINVALEAFYQAAVPAAEMAQRRRTLEGTLRKTLVSRNLSLRQVRQGVGESSKAERYRRYGELLLAHLHSVESGQANVELLDYYEDPPVPLSIPLDPLQSPQQNAERFFKRARHVAENAARLVHLQDRLVEEIAALEAMIKAVAATTSPDEIADLREQAALRSWLADRVAGGRIAVVPGRAEFDGKRVKRHTSAEGYEVLVGENAEANDYLVRHVAQTNDWWLHVRAGTSAHVVVRTGNAPLRVPPATLHFAARLAAANSRGKHSSLVAVDYTLRKYVRRPRKAAPGMVTYTHEKTLDVIPAERGH